MGKLCTMCLEIKEETTHLHLCVSGSEGVDLCEDCKYLVVRLIREGARAVLRRRKAEGHMGAFCCLKGENDEDTAETTGYRKSRSDEGGRV
jgi:hypothetical protein